MLERENISTVPQIQHPIYENSLEDMVLSLNHRLKTVESLLNAKIDRSECMMILETKANHIQMKKIVEELKIQFENNQKITEQKFQQQNKQGLEVVERLKEKLRGKKKQIKKSTHQVPNKNILNMKPQQLYLQSNETMFSLLVDEISNLKESYQILDRNSQQRQRIVINLNNEVCQKIEQLERQLEAGVKFSKQINKRSLLNESGQSWSNSNESQSRMSKKDSQSNLPMSNTLPANKTGSFQEHKLNHMMRSLQGMQKEISTKINIKDVLPIIKKNLQPLSQLVDEVRNYAEDAIESTKKILMSQSEINQELCIVCRIVWWHSFQSRGGYAVWNKEIVNLVPEIFSCQRDTSEIHLSQQGSYIFKILSPSNQLPESILVGGQQVDIIGETLINIEKNTIILVPSTGDQIFISIQKI